MIKIPARLEGAILRRRPWLLRRMRPRNWTDARVDKLISADSQAIVHYQDIRDWRHPRLAAYRPASGLGASRFVLLNKGKVLDGDWDLVRMNFEENDVYRLLHERFALGKAWQEIELFQAYAREIAAGKRRWRHSSTYDELVATALEVERLYQEIRDKGYRTGDDGHSSADEVTVSIGRDGEVLYNNVGGHHRLSIVKLLEIEQIPVQVMLRHRQWQDVRDEVRRAAAPVELSEKARRHLGHPDLADILPAAHIDLLSPSR